MKTNLMKLIAAGCLMIAFVACDKFNHNPSCPELKTSEVPDVVQKAFLANYPSQQAEMWFDKDGKMVVAYFVEGDKRKFAYFGLDGTLLKTEVDLDKDGELKDEKELSCNDFTMPELEEKATICTQKMIEELEEKEAWIKEAIEKGEKDVSELNSSLEEIEEWHVKLEETLELINQGQISKDELCEILKKCWWNYDKECDKDKGEWDKDEKGEWDKKGKHKDGKKGKKGKKDCTCNVDKD